MPATLQDPDPKAPLPFGDWLMILGAAPSAPLSPGLRQSQSQTGATLSGRKALRRPKGPVPRATQIDPAAELGSGQAPPAPVFSIAPSSAVPSPVCNLLQPAFQIGEDDNTTIPPDTHAALGLGHVFAPQNNNVAIFDRRGTLVSRTSLNSFWNHAGINGHTFDPKVVHDPVTDRFYFVSMADAEVQTSRLLIACSETGDPTGQWRTFAIPVDQAAQGPVWMDYPSLGFSDDKITVSVNLFSLAGNAFSGATVYAFDKAAFINLAASIAVQRFVLSNMGATHAPAITLTAGTADQYLVSTWSPNAGGKGYVLVLRIAGSVGAGAASLSRVGYVPCPLIWDSFPPAPDFAPQAGSTAKISIGDDRLQTVVLRDGILSCCHTVMTPQGQPTSSVIQCWDIPVATWIATTFRITDAGGAFLAHPSLAVNNQGDKLIGHSVFAPNLHPSGAYACIPKGSPPQAMIIFAPGSATYSKRFGGSQNRWGDYSATMVDPHDDRNFWTAQACCEAWPPAWPEPGRWETKIAYVGVPLPAMIAAAGTSQGGGAPDPHAPADA